MPWTGKWVTSVMTQLASAAFPVGALFSSPAPLLLVSRAARTCDGQVCQWACPTGLASRVVNLPLHKLQVARLYLMMAL